MPAGRLLARWLKPPLVAAGLLCMLASWVKPSPSCSLAEAIACWLLACTLAGWVESSLFNWFY